MRSTRPSGLRALLAPACCCLVIAACEDDLTGPSAHAHPAGGRMWVAVTPPRGLPDDRTWLPFVSARKGESAPAALRVQGLREEGKRLRREGDLEGALRAEELAAETAAGGIARTPDRATMLAALGSLEAYIGAVDHPYFAVTGEDGSFRIENLPPGTYVLEAWHETLGTQTMNVTVGPNESGMADFSYDAAAALNADVPLGEPLVIHWHGEK